MNKITQHGFTILELMMTVTVAGILLGVGVPALQDFVRANRSVTEVNNLLKGMNLARSEAINRGVEITIAPSSGGDWTVGWSVGIDADDDGTFPEAGETVLRRFPAVDSLSFTAAPARVVFKATGELANVATAQNFTVVPAHCNNVRNRQRNLAIMLAGYVDLTKSNCP